MDKVINKRLSALGVSDKELVKDKSAETIIDKMTSLERLRWLKEKWTDKKNNLTMSYEISLITRLEHKIEAVDQCIKLISYKGEL